MRCIIKTRWQGFGLMLMMIILYLARPRLFSLSPSILFCQGGQDELNSLSELMIIVIIFIMFLKIMAKIWLLLPELSQNQQP
jgi:hypothetical protein